MRRPHTHEMQARCFSSNSAIHAALTLYKGSIALLRLYAPTKPLPTYYPSIKPL